MKDSVFFSFEEKKLLEAVQNADSDRLQELMEANPSVSDNAKYYALQLAIKNGVCGDYWQLLTRWNWNPTESQKTGLARLAARYANLNALRDMVGVGFPIDDLLVCLFCLLTGRLDIRRYILDYSLCDPNRFRQLLIAIAWSGRVEPLRILISSGVQVRQVHVLAAAMCAHFECAELLLKHCENICITDVDESSLVEMFALADEIFTATRSKLFKAQLKRYGTDLANQWIVSRETDELVEIKDIDPIVLLDLKYCLNEFSNFQILPN